MALSFSPHFLFHCYDNVTIYQDAEIKTKSNGKEPSKRRSVFADLAANIDNFEFDFKPRNRNQKTKQSSSRLSIGEVT